MIPVIFMEILSNYHSKAKKNRPFKSNKRFNMVRPVRFERMAFRVGAVLYEVFILHFPLKQRKY